jgi:hypothetical protein
MLSTMHLIQALQDEEDGEAELTGADNGTLDYLNLCYTPRPDL